MKTTFNQHIGIFEDAVSSKWCDSITESLPQSLPVIKFLYKDKLINDRCIRLEPLKNVNYLKNTILGQKIFGKYINRYPLIKELITKESIFGIKDYKIQQFPPSEGLPYWRFDNDINDKEWAKHTLNYILYLTDTEKGEELEFLNQSLKLSPKKGTLYIFPSYFTHAFKINPTFLTTKYIISGWLGPGLSSTTTSN